MLARMGHDILVAGLLLGIAGDALLRAPGPPGINFSGLIALIAAAAYLLHRRSGRDLDRGRLAWMAVVVLAAAALAWRDAPPLKLLALASVTVGFALAAYRHDTSWIRSAGVTQYVAAWAAGALHAWTASALVL